ncbi:serine hydrolase [Kriegella sp. EG-1]|nr:serine hydrolase [Flavobacteriaceae bacterium EG-1]
MRLFYFLFILSILSCKDENKKSTIHNSDFADLQAKLDSLYGAHFNENSPGVALLVLYDNKKVVNKGYGLRNHETKEPITPSTNLRSGSMAKQFTCLGLLKLMEEGKLSLTDTIYQYYPYPIFKNVTIEQFISHTSGIEDADWIIENSTKNSSEFVRNEDLIEWYANNNVIRFPPGTAFEYNNGTYATLAQIIEMVSGMKYEDYIKKHVFDKAGMSRTQFIDDADSSKIPEYAYRYERDSLGQWQSVEGHPMDEVSGAGGIYLSLDDYANYIENHRNKNIVKSESHELIFKPISMNIELHSEDLRILKGKESSYAMGWEITDSMALSAGLWFGTQSFVIYERKRPLTIVMLANNNDFFENRIVDKTYSIVNDYFSTAANNVSYEK